VAGGEFPAGVLVPSEGRAFVTAQRDREVVEIALDGARVTRRIRVGGEPTKLVATRDGTRLYVANANSDSVSEIDVARGAVVHELPTAAPAGSPALVLRGSNPNALALSPDEKRLYVTNGGNSTLAVLDLATRQVVGLVPTGFYPTAVAAPADGRNLYVAFAKSPTGPNPAGPLTARERNWRDPYGPGRGNQYALQLSHAGLLAFPTPDAAALAKLTRQSIANNRFDAAQAVPPLFAALQKKVKHVLYVIGENRTYDQILGDLPGADGDPRLVLWGEAITPNQHALARTFVTLDRFFDAGGVSGDGWQWTVSGRTTDVAEKEVPIEYAGRGTHSYDWEGANRNINVSRSGLEERQKWDPRTPDGGDLLPGVADVAAVDGPAEGGRGFLWDAVLTAGKSLRNYGVFCNDLRDSLRPGDPALIPLMHDPFGAQVRVAFPTRAQLHEVTDPYYRGFDMKFADFWREAEWEREFDGYVKDGKLPAFELIRLPHDHLGSFESAIDGVNTPDTQIADKDYALGRIVARVSLSPYWADTVVVALEDDAQNGSDHVDAHRSVLFFAGGHVKRGVKLSKPYATPSVLRTIELLLGVAPLGQPDAFAPPIEEAFSLTPDMTPFVAQVPAVLRTTQLPLPGPATGEKGTRPRGDAARWAALMRGQDFSRPDALDPEAFNRALACGLRGEACGSVPAVRSENVRRRDGEDDD
jgi:YVTN family beta-propeller protein